MSSPVRPVRAPRWLRAVWVVSVLLGAAVVVVPPGAASTPPPSDRTGGPGDGRAPATGSVAGLTPATVATFLSRIPPPGSVGIRVNGIYGSGHAGAWEFVAHLTWHRPDGEMAGGVVRLPALAGAAPEDLGLGTDRLAAEERIGWTLAELGRALLAATDGSDPALALVELSITPDGAGDLVSCVGASGPGPGRCAATDRRGVSGPPFTATLADTPADGALSVSRRAKMAG